METEPGDHQLSFKFTLVGESAVGNTAICKQFCEHTFNENQPTTVGLEFGTRIIEDENTRIKLQVWDTAGQERFHSITRAYFRSSAAVFYVFDVTNRESFQKLATWVEEGEQGAPPTAVMVMIGNKTDLVDQRAVSTPEAQDFAQQHGLTLFETSALSGDKIEDAFIKTAHVVHAKVRDGTIDLNNASSGARAPVTQVAITGEAEPNRRSCC